MKRWFSFLLWYCLFGIPAAAPAPKVAAIRITAVVAAALPQGTTPVGLPNGSPKQVSVTWTASAAVTGVTVAGYNVFRSTTAGGEAGALALNGSSVIAGTSFVDTTVVAGTKYFYVVAAQDTNGFQSGFSNEASITPPPNPANPTGCSTHTP